MTEITARKKSFWSRLTFSQKLSIVFIGSFVVATPLAVVASLQQTRTDSKAALNIIPTSPFRPTASPVVIPQTLTINDATGSLGKFMPQEKIVARIGEENIYNKDLNYYLFTYYKDRYLSKEDPNILRTLALDYIKRESVIFQMAVKKGVMPKSDLDSGIYNSLTKVYERRWAKLAQISSILESRQEKASGAILTLYYFNMKPPKMELSEAQKIASSSMQKIYDEIKSGKITFEQGADAIKNNPQMPRIDTQYKVNAYNEVKNVSPGQFAFTFKELNSAFWKLAPGEITPVLHISYMGAGNVTGEAFYAIIKKNSVSNPGTGKLTDQIAQTEKEIGVQIYAN